jgi:hypothetical protein
MAIRITLQGTFEPPRLPGGEIDQSVFPGCKTEEQVATFMQEQYDNGEVAEMELVDSMDETTFNVSHEAGFISD